MIYEWGEQATLVIEDPKHWDEASGVKCRSEEERV